MNKQSQTIFMLGIGGAGMQALAVLLAARGHRIVGCDYDLAKIAALPTLTRFEVAPEDQAAPLLKEADRLVYTDAAPADHPLRRQARRLGLRQQMLFAAMADFAKDLVTLAVTGTHGKSSTTAFLGHLLVGAGFDPTVAVGAGVKGWATGNARVGKGTHFVVEADEYRHHFLHFSPAHAIITSIDFDHPDFFKSLADVEDAYAAFLGKLTPHGYVICPQALPARHPRLPWPNTTVAVPPPAERFPLALPGKHMQYNAALAITLAQKLGVPAAVATASIATFPGLSRRFEVLGALQGATIISDYGHHPTEIAATLAAAREQYTDQKILALVEPHTSQRVECFLAQFVMVLDSAACDGVLVYPTFYVPGRDDEAQASASTTALTQALIHARTNVWQVEDSSSLLPRLTELLPQFDVAIAFTAGALDAKLRALVQSG